MTVNDIKNTYLAASGKVSDYTRSTNFSAIALIWILSKENIDNIAQYKFILSLFFLSLVFDYLQYLWKTLAVMRQYKKEDNKVNQDENSEVRFYSYIQYGTWTFWGLKVICTMWGAVDLLKCLWGI